MRLVCNTCEQIAEDWYSFTPPLCWSCYRAMPDPEPIVIPAPRGPGQPKKGRSASLPRISPAHFLKLKRFAQLNSRYLADVLEDVIDLATQAELYRRNPKSYAVPPSE